MIKRPPTNATATKEPAKADADLPFEQPVLPVQNSQIKGTKEIHFDQKQETDETVKVDFVDDAYANDMSAKTTKAAADIPRIDPNTPADKVREQTKQYEEDKTNKLTFKHYQEIAEFLVHILDVGMSNALNWIAKDTARSAYALPVADKKSLSDQLALILCKYQSKFSIEFTFLLALVVIYSGPAMLAFRKKKENSLLPTSTVKKENPTTAYVRHEPMAQKVEPVNNGMRAAAVEVKKEVIVDAPIVKAVISRPPVGARRRGRQAKA